MVLGMSSSNTENNFLLSAYSFSLPKDQIAQYPCKRGKSRLLVLTRQNNKTISTHFSKILEYLPSNSLLIANNTRVFPARIFCSYKEKRIEFFLLTPIVTLDRQAKKFNNGYEKWSTVVAEALIKPGRKVTIGTKFYFEKELEIEILKKEAFGRHIVKLRWRGSLSDIFFSYGHIPLPPYIHQSDNLLDNERYQTIYSRVDKLGSVASPTAGLHFSKNIHQRLQKNGVRWAEVTLHVGYGTFSPIRCEDIRKHVMHPEYVEIPESTVKAIQQARLEGRPIFAIGTTVVRALEGVGVMCGSLKPYTGFINLFISPGYKFNYIDGLITNFHLPGSTLLILVSAFTGRKVLLNAYNKAINLGYRFFSYGDAMLII